MTDQVVFFRAIFDYDLEIEVTLLRRQGDKQTTLLQFLQVNFLVLNDEPDIEVGLN